MFRNLQRSPATVATILAGVVAFALVNPFCCHLLPYFEGEPAPGERTVDELTAPCPGKPEAVHASAMVPPDLVVINADLPRPVMVPAPARTPWRIKASRKARAGPPRHVLFGVLLI